MSENQGDQEPGKNGDDNNGPSIVSKLVWVLIAVVSIAILFNMGNNTEAKADLTITRFKELVAEGKVALVKIFPPAGIAASYPGKVTLAEGAEKDLEDAPKANEKGKVVYSITVISETVPDIEKLCAEHGVKYDAVEPEDGTLGEIFRILLIPLLIIVFLYFLFSRQMRGAGKGAMSFGKSRAKLKTASSEKVTFDDVAGINEARSEVEEIVDFLKTPEKYRNLGGRLPKGCLMVGPPGTGKTLLARAIAGEADVPFYSMSGSDFVEMFVGVGASRVRDMFEQAKKNQPCILFIDEIDAVGRTRFNSSGGGGGGHDEREQTLNALLVEMDGFENQQNVIILAATNRADVLDPALLRPGRFDRRIVVDLPDVEGRKQILAVHSKKVKMAASVVMDTIAKGTAGFSGADLANVINEAALLAAGLNKKAVDLDDLEEARDKVRWGIDR